MRGVAFFTPSFRGDFERFRLLRKSIRKFYQGNAPHWAVVPKADQDMFRELADGDTNLIVDVQNRYVSKDFYPRWWHPAAVRFLSRWPWDRYAGRPGWYIQQIVKLSADLIAPAHTYIVCDSDTIFARPFHDRDLHIAPDTRCLFREDPDWELKESHKELMASASEILQLPAVGVRHHYFNWPVVFFSDWLAELRKHIERVHGQPWQRVLFDAPIISEYCLYGVFLEEIVGLRQGVVRAGPNYYGIWDRTSFDAFFVQKTKDLKPCLTGMLALVIQSNLRTLVDLYEGHVVDCLDLDSS